LSLESLEAERGTPRGSFRMEYGCRFKALRELVSGCQITALLDVQPGFLKEAPDSGV
jgi:hypothetical protein